MKKMIALVLGLAMLLCAVSVTAEETREKQTLGVVSINGAFSLKCELPDNYETIPVSVMPEHVITLIKSSDPNAPIMTLSVAYDEQYYDVERMNDLDQEAMALLEQTFIDADPEVEITYRETGYGTRLLVARHDTDSMDYISFFSIYKGYCVEFVLWPSDTAEDRNLTEDQVNACIRFLTELDFIPAGGVIDGKQAVAGQTLITNLTDFDAETSTVTGTVMHSVPLPAAQVEALRVGDTLTAGQFSEEIQSLEKTEEGDILINGETELRKDGDEYRIYTYELEYIEAYVTMRLEITDSLVVRDNINKDTGEPLDEPVTYTADEFRAMLAAGSYPDFATDNTWVTFDENGEMVLVERVYSPAQ